MLDVEVAFFSCLLNKPEYLDLVKSKIDIAYFSDEESKIVYKAIVEAENLNIPFLAQKNGFKIDYLLSIQQQLNIVSEFTVRQYAYGVIEAYKKREIIRLAEQGNVEAINNIAKLNLEEEKEQDESVEFLHILDDKIQGKEDIRNVRTGYHSIDEKINGIRKSEFIILGARPAMGKTCLGMNLAFNIARQGKKVLFCSIEMNKIDLHERLVKSIVQLGNGIYRPTESQFNEIIRVSKKLKNETPLTIYDKPAMTFEDIVYKVRKDKPEVLVIDHLAILNSKLMFGKPRYEVVKYLTGNLKALAREMDIPIICLAQLNRTVEGRDIKAPTLSDLRDSGSIEEDADLIFFLHRPEYYLDQARPDDKDKIASWQQSKDEVKGIAYLSLAKNRRGWTGRFNLKFDGENYLFKE